MHLFIAIYLHVCPILRSTVVMACMKYILTMQQNKLYNMKTIYVHVYTMYIVCNIHTYNRCMYIQCNNLYCV